MSGAENTPRSRGIPTMWAVAGAIAIAVASAASAWALRGRARPASSSVAPHTEEESEKAIGRTLSLPRAYLEQAELGIQPVGSGSLDLVLSLPGEVGVNAESLVHMTPRMQGVARQVDKRLGDTVKKGEILAILDSAALADLERDASSAKAKLTLAEATLARLEPLYREKVTTERDYLAAKQSVDEAKIDVRAAGAKLAASGAGGTSGGYALLSPIDGTIVERHISVGEVVREDTRVFVVADLSSVWVDLSIYAQDLPRVDVGQTVRVHAQGIDQPALGKIGFIGPVASEETRSVRARVVLDRPGEAWRPGLFVTADVTVAHVEADIVIADDTFQTIEGKPCVFVAKGEGEFETREVKLGRSGLLPNGKKGFEVQSGLQNGDRIVVDNAFVLKAELGKSAGGDED